MKWPLEEYPPKKTWFSLIQGWHFASCWNQVPASWSKFAKFSDRRCRNISEAPRKCSRMAIFLHWLQLNHTIPMNWPNLTWPRVHPAKPACVWTWSSSMLERIWKAYCQSSAATGVPLHDKGRRLGPLLSWASDSKRLCSSIPNVVMWNHHQNDGSLYSLVVCYITIEAMAQSK